MGPQARAPGSGRQAHLFVAISVRACWNVAAQRDDKFRFLWRWHLFLIHFNYDNTKISCRWHLFLIHFNYEHSQSVSQSVISRSRPALIRKYLVQLLISSHTIRQSAAPCREHSGRARASRPASRVSLINDRFGSKRGKGRAALSGTPHWSLRRGEAAETGERLLY